MGKEEGWASISTSPVFRLSLLDDKHLGAVWGGHRQWHRVSILCPVLRATYARPSICDLVRRGRWTGLIQHICPTIQQPLHPRV
jgi:hypothetical protein